MILHTPLSYGMIIDILNQTYHCGYCRVQGVWCQTTNGRVERILSTDPDDFLKPDLTPGVKITDQRGIHGYQKENSKKKDSR